MDNSQVADVFTLLAKIMDIHGENGFKIKTYSNAAFQIKKLAEPLASLETSRITAINGIGDATGKKITELLTTGKLSVLEKYLAETPPGIIEMLAIKDLGPKKINIIWKEMEIESVGELLYACNESRLSRYKGFGEKNEQNIKEAVEFYLSQQGYLLYKQAVPVATAILQSLQIAFPSNNIETTGDYRRQSETMEEIAFVTDISDTAVKSFFGKQPDIELTAEDAGTLKYKLATGTALKLICCHKTQFGFVLFETTGPSAFVNHFLRKFPASERKNFRTNNELELFNNANLPFIQPYLRDAENILDVAAAGGLKEPLHVADVKGIIHCHSTWSDGKHTIRQMAEAAIKQGFEYLVMTDHSRSAGYAGGLSIEQIALQQLETDSLNNELAPFKIFKGIESDILTDGSLDYPAHVLESFDLVIASVHSGIKMSEEKATTRLLKAIENPYTTVLGHPTGRLLLSRAGYPVNHKKIIDACAANNVVIELNANPRRLDLDWRWISYALEKNVLVSINPDAHSTAGFNDVAYGVFAAQKAMLTSDFNLSSFNLKKLEDYLQKKKARLTDNSRL